MAEGNRGDTLAACHRRSDYSRGELLTRHRCQQLSGGTTRKRIDLLVIMIAHSTCGRDPNGEADDRQQSNVWSLLAAETIARPRQLAESQAGTLHMIILQGKKITAGQARIRSDTGLVGTE